MLEFQNIEVIVNNSGIMAESASLSSANALTPMFALGRRGSIAYSPVGNLTHNLNISYIPETIWEPNLEIIQYLRTAHTEFTYQPLTGSLGGVSGYYYLQSYNLKSSPNQPNKATASYISFQQLSGGLQLKPAAVVYDPSNSTGVMHSWTTIPNLDGDAPLIHEFEYDFKANWNPLYLLGSIYPSQIQLVGGTESISFVRDVNTFILFSGDTSVNTFDLNVNNPTVLLTGLSYINNLPNGKGYLIDCSGLAINSEITAVVGEIVKVRTTVVRSF